MGLEDKAPSQWDGTVTVSEGRVTHISGWRFVAEDKVDGLTGWTARTRPVSQVGRSNNAAKGKAKAKAAERTNGAPPSDNGVMISLADVNDRSMVSIKTSQGNFDFSLSELTYGSVLEKLDGAVEVERTGSAEQLSQRRTDDDYPSIAVASDGTMYVAYVSYTPANNRDDYNRVEGPNKTASFAGNSWIKSPEDFTFLSKLPGGDQVWLKIGKAGKWSEPIAVTKDGKDIYKCQVAIDGNGKAWVLWSENETWPNKTPNFEIHARSFQGEALSEIVNLSRNEANDINPAVATDSNGRVWLAWQGVREGVFQIIERHQMKTGEWSPERVVTKHQRNCWTPAVACSKNGKVAIAWDTYDQGDYDVWFREYSISGGEAGDALPVANTEDYEARPSLSYDSNNGLWIAYEMGSPTWGKNFGPYAENQGTPLYRGRQVGLIVWKDGQWNEPEESHYGSLSGAKVRKRVVNQRVAAIEPQGESLSQARNAEWLRDAAYNNLSRVAVDSSGHVWLFCRSRQNDFRFPVLGSLWLNWVTYYDGKKWTGPILLPNSDNLMYNVPSVAALPSGGLVVAHSTDHRQERFPVRDPSTSEGPGEAWTVPGDPFDNDVYLSRLTAPGPAVSTLALKPAKYAPEKKTAPSTATVDELAAIARCHNTHFELGNRTLRLIRGEFHRHTEISGDGGGDGPLEDMWRYGLDVAGMDWLGNADHDNGAGREYTWWLTQKTADAFRIAGRFEPPFTYERSVKYPEGHRNVLFAQRGVRTLPRLPVSDRDSDSHAPDTQMLYKYLRHFGGVCASHTSATSMGTDWRDNDPEVEPFVEIYQGDRQNYERPGAPRCPTAENSIGGWEPKGFVNLALQKGYRLAFECSSDHISTHISYTMVYAEANSTDALIKAIKERHTYGATDNIIADFRCTADGVLHIMGEEFSSTKPPTFDVKLTGTAPFAKVTLVKDDVEIPMSVTSNTQFSANWTDTTPTPGKTSYYYIRGEQTDGELVWVSPMWVKYAP